MMDTNKNISEDKLSELFRGIPFDEPSPDFMENLLQRIEKEVLASEQKKYRWITIGQVAAGVLGMLILPALIIYLCTLYLPDFSFSLPKIHFDFDINLLTIGFSILMLLIIDTLFRMHKANHTEHNSK